MFIIRGGRHERPVYREGDTSVGGTIRPRQGQEGVTVEAAIARNHVSYAVWSRNVIISRLGSARLVKEDGGRKITWKRSSPRLNDFEEIIRLFLYEEEDDCKEK